MKLTSDSNLDGRSPGRVPTHFCHLDRDVGWLEIRVRGQHDSNRITATPAGERTAYGRTSIASRKGKHRLIGEVIVLAAEERLDGRDLLVQTLGELLPSDAQVFELSTESLPYVLAQHLNLHPPAAAREDDPIIDGLPCACQGQRHTVRMP